MHNIRPKLKVILVTGSEPMPAEQLKAGNFAAVVSDPFTAEELLVAMDKVLHG